MIDLTAITTPFGLLDRETQEALKAELRKPDGRLEMFDGREWCDSKDSPAHNGWLAYRVKPAPPKPREWWLTDNGCSWETYEEAKGAYGDPDEKIVHVREVLPE